MTELNGDMKNLTEQVMNYKDESRDKIKFVDELVSRLQKQVHETFASIKEQ